MSNIFGGGGGGLHPPRPQAHTLLLQEVNEGIFALFDYRKFYGLYMHNGIHSSSTDLRCNV